MITISQCRVRSKRPLAFTIHFRRTQHFTIVIDSDGAARLSFTAEGWSVVIGGIAVVQRALIITDVIGHHQIFHCVRRFGIHFKVEDTGLIAGLTHRAGSGSGNVVFTVSQCRIRNKCPDTFAVSRCRT